MIPELRERCVLFNKWIERVENTCNKNENMINMNTTHLLANLKIERLNPMQEAVGKAYAENKSLVVLSPTGSGKTSCL